MTEAWWESVGVSADILDARALYGFRVEEVRRANAMGRWSLENVEKAISLMRARSGLD